ncbi:hypothetical protein K438DRAFT_1964117 [Mycena galopus ATCC 62051]|nr:hypothetical protein K438DRAFT_1964117 [Mycena galopus ATCC 62051]
MPQLGTSIYSDPVEADLEHEPLYRSYVASCACGFREHGTLLFGFAGTPDLQLLSLLSATGSDYGLMSANPNFQKTEDFHMYITGSTSLFNYGDQGPNKYPTTANSLILRQLLRPATVRVLGRTWTDVNGPYVAMKAGTNLYHQAHNNLDCGNFVLDALGTRWAGELGMGGGGSIIRKMTEGQNTIFVNKAN